MPFLSREGVQIHYEAEGTGPAILFHTGAGGDLQIWRHAGYLDRLAGFRKILIDQRGRGRSGRPASLEDHRIERFAEDAVAVLDAESVEHAGFWGYSNGILVGLAVAGTYPGRIRCLVGLGSLGYRDYSDLPSPSVESEIRSDVEAGGVQAEVDRRETAENDRFPTAIDLNVRAGDPLMHALDGVAWMQWRGPKTVLDQLSQPLLMLTGEREDPNKVTENMVAHVPKARMLRVPGLGHLAIFYRSDVTVPLALPFLREHLG